MEDASRGALEKKGFSSRFERTSEEPSSGTEPPAFVSAPSAPSSLLSNTFRDGYRVRVRSRSARETSLENISSLARIATTRPTAFRNHRLCARRHARCTTSVTGAMPTNRMMSGTTARAKSSAVAKRWTPSAVQGAPLATTRDVPEASSARWSASCASALAAAASAVRARSLRCVSQARYRSVRLTHRRRDVPRYRPTRPPAPREHCATKRLRYTAEARLTRAHAIARHDSA